MTPHARVHFTFLGSGQRNPSGTAADELHHEFECMAAILPAQTIVGTVRFTNRGASMYGSLHGPRSGMQEVFHAMEYLPHARATHQRSPDEDIHEIQTE